MKQLKIVEQIPSVDVLKTMEKPYVLLEEGTNKLQYNYEEKVLPQADAGDIVYKTADGKFKAVKSTDWSSDLGTAVGVCVIPTSHDVYKGTDDKGKCAILSLSQATSKQWGGYGTDIDGLTDITVAPYTTDITTQTEILEKTGYTFLPSNKFSGSGVENTFDAGTYWSTNGDPNTRCPSLYASDGSRNASINVGALNDFDGIKNTDEIIKKFGDAEPYQQKTDYAAKVASEMTDGDLDWYLPAMGELAYIMPRFNQINEGLSKVGTQMGTSVAFWSSSEYDLNLAWLVNTYRGNVYFANKLSSSNVLGFARVSLSV